MLTTAATTQDVACTALIHQSLKRNQRLPSRHFVDAGYVDAGLLVESSSLYAIELFGPTRLNPSWQSRSGGYDQAQFQIDWSNQSAVCPEGKRSVYWVERQTNERYWRRVVTVRFNRKDCRDCSNRNQCVKTKSGTAWSLNLPPQPLYEALETIRNLLISEDGRREYQNRAGIEGTLSQAVRRGSFRRSRYRGLQKTHLQEVATAAGINLLRTINFLYGKPLAKTRVSRFAKLAH